MSYLHYLAPFQFIPTVKMSPCAHILFTIICQLFSKHDIR